MTPMLVGLFSFKDGSNRKQVLTFDGKKYTNGLPEAKWSGGKFAN